MPISFGYGGNMIKIEKICIVLMLLLIPTYLCAMHGNNDIILDEMDSNSLKKPLPQLKKSRDIGSHNQKLDNGEEEESCNNYAPKSLSCWGNTWSYWNNISYIWKELLGWNQNSIQVQRTNIYSLPNEVFWHIADFLGSIDILKLSSTCQELRQVFNGDYWITYLSKRPKVHSYLILKGSLSPSLHRKAFFSHLWYSEGRINLAAKLNHPEALVLQSYGTYGAYIGKDQYLCPSGFIRYISGKVDNERTDRLKEAERKKGRANIERNEILKKKQDQMIKYHSSWNGNWKRY